MESEQALPVGWERVPLANVCEKVPNVKPEDEPDREFGYVDISSISNTTFTIGETKRFSGKDAPSRARRPIVPGDVLFSTVRTYLRNIAIVPRGLDADLCSTGFTVLRSNGAIIPQYLFYHILSDEFVDAVTPQQTGTQYPATSDRVVLSTPIPLPPLPEQRRIVAGLEALLADIERVRGRLEGVAATMQRFRQAVLAAAFSGNLTAEWRRAHGDDIETCAWVLSTISAVSLVSGGLTKNRKRSGYDTQLPYLRVANVYADQLDLSEVEEIGVDANELPRILLKKGDLLIVEGNGSLEQIGRVALWNGEIEPCVHQNHIIKIRFSDATDRRFALYWLLSPGGRQAITDVATSTSGLHTLSISKVENLPIPLPPLAEQHEIVRRVEALFALADRIEGEVARALERVEALAQSVLAKAFRGELVPTEAELARREGRAYEPAAVLLERVRAGRAGRLR